MKQIQNQMDRQQQYKMREDPEFIPTPLPPKPSPKYVGKDNQGEVPVVTERDTDEGAFPPSMVEVPTKEKQESPAPVAMPSKSASPVQPSRPSPRPAPADDDDADEIIEERRIPKRKRKIIRYVQSSDTDEDYPDSSRSRRVVPERRLPLKRPLESSVARPDVFSDVYRKELMDARRKMMMEAVFGPQ